MFRRVEPDLHRQREIAERFRALWELLRPGGDADEDEFRHLMRDQIRDALDRGTSDIPAKGAVEFIANSFVVEHVLAEGEMTQVLALRHRDLGTLHAMKCARVQAHVDPVTRNLLLREASIGLDLADPHIVRTQMLLRLQDGRVGIVMERSGQSLAQIAKSGPISVEVIRDVVEATLLALQSLHHRGFVHGDISPGNILKNINAPRQWQLCDLGLCTREGERFALDDIARAGTLAFQPPEQTAGEAADRRSDLYAVGRILEWMETSLPDDVSPDEDLMHLASDLTRNDPADRPVDIATCLARLNRADK